MGCIFLLNIYIIEFVFFIIRGANHTNLYKNLIKIQMFNINLGTIRGARPLPAPLSPPLSAVFMVMD